MGLIFNFLFVTKKVGFGSLKLKITNQPKIWDWNFSIFGKKGKIWVTNIENHKPKIRIRLIFSYSDKESEIWVTNIENHKPKIGMELTFSYFDKKRKIWVTINIENHKPKIRMELMFSYFDKKGRFGSL